MESLIQDSMEMESDLSCGISDILATVYIALVDSSCESSIRAYTSVLQYSYREIRQIVEGICGRMSEATYRNQAPWFMGICEVCEMEKDLSRFNTILSADGFGLGTVVETSSSK